MTERQRGEKEEKDEKQEEKDEKGREEKWRRDPLGAIAWAAILIWVGLVFLGENLGLLAGVTVLAPWALIFAGAGVILILEVIVRLLVPAYRRPVLGTLILAVIFLAIGIGDVIRLDVLVPAALIVLGIIILLRGLFERR